MAISLNQGHCRTSAPEDNDRAVAVIPPMTASVVPLAGNIPSTPPRNKQVFGLPTPLATPDSNPPLRLNSSGHRFTSPSPTPTRGPNVPKDTTPLTISGNPSKCDSDKSTVIPYQPRAGLLTPDSTPPRKPRITPISHKEETEESKLIFPLKITSTVTKIPET
jgi:hypothetical protein